MACMMDKPLPNLMGGMIFQITLMMTILMWEWQIQRVQRGSKTIDVIQILTMTIFLECGEYWYAIKLGCEFAILKRMWAILCLIIHWTHLCLFSMQDLNWNNTSGRVYNVIVIMMNDVSYAILSSIASTGKIVIIWCVSIFCQDSQDIGTPGSQLMISDA